MITFYKNQFNNLFFISAVFCVIFRLVGAATVDGCQPQSDGLPGFDMSLYHYPYKTVNGARSCFNDEYQTPDFQQGGYETYGGGIFGQASGIDNIDLSIRLQDLCTPTMGNLPSNFNYHEEFTVSNFTMLLTGYFLPQKSGNYIFNLEADDLAYLSFGAGNAFECCRSAGTISKPGSFSLIVIWNGADQMSGSVSYELLAGVYYPIRLLYANRDYHGDLLLTFTDPDGTTYSTFTDHIYQFPDETNGCAKRITTMSTTTNPWEGSSTRTLTVATLTYTGTDDVVTVETIYAVETPSSESVVKTSSTEYFGDEQTEKSTEVVTTTFTVGTADTTTTYSTATNVFTGSDGIITTETTYFVQTPSGNSEVETATTTFTPGTVNITTTYSTATNVFTGSDGIITTETTYFVQTPSSNSEVETATTTFTVGTADITTTYSTATNVFTGSDGIITTETTYFVQTPSGNSEVETATTAFTPGTVNITTTYSTATNVFTGSDGMITTETTYFVQTPSGNSEVETATTTFTPGTIDTTTTYSTKTITLTGPDGVTTTETVYYVETPLETVSTAVTTVISDATVSSRTTIRTISTTLIRTDNNGNVVIVVETNYYVAIPTKIPLVTQASSIRHSSTLADQSRNGTSETSSNISASVTQYQGNGSNISHKMYSFIFGLCFSLLLV